MQKRLSNAPGKRNGPAARSTLLLPSFFLKKLNLPCWRSGRRPGSNASWVLSVRSLHVLPVGTRVQRSGFIGKLVNLNRSKLCMWAWPCNRLATCFGRLRPTVAELAPPTQRPGKGFWRLMEGICQIEVKKPLPHGALIPRHKPDIRVRARMIHAGQVFTCMRIFVCKLVCICTEYVSACMFWACVWGFLQPSGMFSGF